MLNYGVQDDIVFKAIFNYERSESALQKCVTGIWRMGLVV